MKYDPTIHHRRSIRLKGYDYTQPGAYFVTLVTFQREHRFGEISKGEMALSPEGKIAAFHWKLFQPIFQQQRLENGSSCPITSTGSSY